MSRRVKFHGKAGDTANSPSHESEWIEVDDDTTDEELSEMAFDFAIEAVRVESWYVEAE